MGRNVHWVGYRTFLKTDNNALFWKERDQATPMLRLGLILFLAFINDLPKCIKCWVRLFADDTVVYLVVKSADVCLKLQQDLQSLERWEKDWKMAFNILPNAMFVELRGDKHLLFSTKNFTIALLKL